jgi:phospholipid/cholesterol/gamma-HCH transport system substrate-binding protein
MSDHLFPRVASRSALELRLAALAVILAAIFGGFSLWLGASYVGLIGGDVKATARLVTLGDSLGVNSPVKFRGLKVGRVVTVDNVRDAGGLYRAHIVIDDEHAGMIPSTVVARVLPGTLFGAEYVELRQADGATTVSTGSSVRDGEVLAADTSEETVRLMDTFSSLYRVIDQIDPVTLDKAVTQLAEALDGRGDDLNGDVRRVTALVRDYAGAEPTFYRDLDHLTSNLDTLADVEPELAATLRHSLPVAETIADKAKRIKRLTASTTTLSKHVNAFLGANSSTLASLLDNTAPTYRTFASNQEAFNAILHLAPPVLDNGAGSIKDGAIQMEAKFSLGTHPPYTATDCPRYGSLVGSNCK